MLIRNNSLETETSINVQPKPKLTNDWLQNLPSAEIQRELHMKLSSTPSLLQIEGRHMLHVTGHQTSYSGEECIRKKRDLDFEHDSHVLSSETNSIQTITIHKTKNAHVRMATHSKKISHFAPH